MSGSAGLHAVLTSTASRKNISSWDARLLQKHSEHMGWLLDELLVPEEGASKCHLARMRHVHRAFS